METDPIADAEALIASGRAAEAARDLRARLAAGRGGLLARMTLVKALLAAGDIPAALDEARETAALNPGIAVAVMALGEALLRAGALPAAIAELQRALRLDPQLARARFLTACAWLEAGEAEKALEIFGELDASPQIEDLVARARAIGQAPRSDAGYVRHLFDQFSADYDSRMIGQLAYAAPQILRDLADLVMPGRERLAILDLGCGTGLAGAMFKSMAARLDGVDLSPAMIDKARGRGIYHSLLVGDIETREYGQIRSRSWPPTRWSIWAILDRCFAPSPGCCRRMVIFSSPRKQKKARVLSLAPNAAGGTAKPICADRPRQRDLAWPDLWPLRHAPKPISRFRASRSH